MKVIVVGIGNPILKDDSVGIKVVERLKELGINATFAVGFDILDAILGHDKAIVVDAIRTDGKPGTIYELSLEDLAVRKPINSHSIDLATVIRIGYLLFPERMPKEIKVFAVEVRDISIGEGCSPEVEMAIPKVIELIKREIHSK